MLLFMQNDMKLACNFRARGRSSDDGVALVLESEEYYLPLLQGRCEA
jgi:hypothetical protein